MKIEKADLTVNAKWANLNKNNEIGEYCYEVFMKNDYEVNKMRVIEIVTLNYEEWYAFKNGLLEDRDWLADKGGTEEVFTLVDEKEQLYKKSYQMVGLLVQLEDSNEVVAVDPEGYNYARYVGIDVEKL